MASPLPNIVVESIEGITEAAFTASISRLSDIESQYEHRDWLGRTSPQFYAEWDVKYLHSVNQLAIIKFYN